VKTERTKIPRIFYENFGHPRKWTYLAAIDPAIIKNWRLFYAARTVALLESRNKGSKVRPWLGKNDSSKEVVPIENCAYGLVPFEEKNLPSGFKWYVNNE